MIGNRGLVTVGMNFRGIGLQFVAPKNDNTFNDPISCFPCQSTSLFSNLPKNQMKNTFSASTTIVFCHPKDSKCPRCPLRVKQKSPN